MYDPGKPAPKFQMSGLGAGRMYFFNIVYGTETVLDTDGTDLPDVKAAHQEAVAIAEELKCEFPGYFQDGSFVEVVAENGQRIITVPIAAGAQGYV